MQKIMNKLLCSMAVATLPLAVLAQDENYPTRPYFGDTHVHTAFSMDAGAFGARLTPQDAYAFAKGKQIKSSSGQMAQLSRPLDFLVVADHSDGMGFFPLLLKGDKTIMANATGQKWHDMIYSGQGKAAALDIIVQFSMGTFPQEIMPVPGTESYANAWSETIRAAEAANDPGKFTAFIGYEWTSQTGGNNLHRNVIYRDGGDKAKQMSPYITTAPIGSDNPLDLWQWMEDYQSKTGGQVLAIAHNGNLSNGLMFPRIETFGKKIDKNYVQQRAKWEPLIEITQMKGTSEAHPFLSPTDEFANFEIWDKGNLSINVAKKPDMLQYEYARPALKTGLQLQAELGTNPYKFGFVGSTDTHTGLSTADENNFFGKLATNEPNPNRLHSTLFKNAKTGIEIKDWEISSSGYAGVWATENTRAAIFDAMLRKETYATTGPRMIVRFFGGWDFNQEDLDYNKLAQAGYSKGVPMGGDLRAVQSNNKSANNSKKAPSFLVAAMRDPAGANLNRVQIIKGWLDNKGETHEKIYEVVWSDADKRKLDKQGKLSAVGNTVDIADASYRNDIGAAQLKTLWQDPDFNASQNAFYYARVLEIPTPRWTAYDAKRYAVEPESATPMVLQERAYTSPIWYTASQ